MSTGHPKGERPIDEEKVPAGEKKRARDKGRLTLPISGYEVPLRGRPSHFLEKGVLRKGVGGEKEGRGLTIAGKKKVVIVCGRLSHGTGNSSALLKKGEKATLEEGKKWVGGERGSRKRYFSLVICDPPMPPEQKRNLLNLDSGDRG